MSAHLRARWRGIAVLIVSLCCVQLQLSVLVTNQVDTGDASAAAAGTANDFNLPPLPVSTDPPLLLDSSRGAGGRHRTKPETHVHPYKNANVSFGPLDDSALLELYNAARDPIMMQDKPQGSINVRVLAFLHKDRNILFRKEDISPLISDELLNICLDGFERSGHFTVLDSAVIPDFTIDPDFVLKEEEDVVWVVDMRRTVNQHKYTISRQLVHLVNSTLAFQKEHFSEQQHQRLPKLQIVLMDYRDRITTKTLCTSGIRQVIELLGGEPGIVRSVMQQVVRGRHWDETLRFPDLGHVWDNRPDAACFGASPLHVPYTVRSDYVEAVLQTYYQYLAPNKSQNSRYPADTIRLRDVAHFWPQRNSTKGHAALRNTVSETIMGYQQQWNVTTEFVSHAAAKGRIQVAPEYLEALLTTKIIVVAQRDGWEDHYRLFEAIIGGALVMTDPMITLPEGLVHMESIVVYKSIQDLQSQLEYFLDSANESERLTIARKGWEVAMSRHRTYHWMEKLFFGRRLTS